MGLERFVITKVLRTVHGYDCQILDKPLSACQVPHSTMIFFEMLKCMKNDQMNDAILLLMYRDPGAWIEL
jgi:hypothetical protein